MKRRATALDPPLQVVTGKGGVGKSTFAAALALSAARRGHAVLALELGAPAGLARLLGVRPQEHGVPVPVATDLHLAYYDGEQALAEFLWKQLPFPRLMRRVVTHPLYEAFAAAGPGVRELMAIGKVQDELLGLSAGAPQWDLIVLDAGASGHALQLLGMPAATARTFGGGMAHRESSRVAGVLADPSATAVHVVALPEKMPLAEAAEAVERLRALQLPVGKLVINQCWPVAPEGAAALVAGLATQEAPAARCLSAVGARALHWSRLQEQGVERLEARVGLPALRLPRLVERPFGAAQLEVLAELVQKEVRV